MNLRTLARIARFINDPNLVDLQRAVLKIFNLAFFGIFWGAYAQDYSPHTTKNTSGCELRRFLSTPILIFL